jgi:2-methylfumaryl-CoA isomerase
MLGNLGIIGEATINGHDRPKMGNSLYGAYAQDFVCRCGGRVMVVALTLRQWDNLKAATHTQTEFDALATKLGANLSLEGERFTHRHAITDVLKPFFDKRRVEDFAHAFDERSVTWSRYRTFTEAVREDPDISTDNPLFAMVNHPGVGEFLTPGSPISFSGAERIPPVHAPTLGEHTEQILTEIGYESGEIATLHDDNIVASPR